MSSECVVWHIFAITAVATTYNITLCMIQHELYHVTSVSYIVGSGYDYSVCAEACNFDHKWSFKLKVWSGGGLKGPFSTNKEAWS